MGAAQSSIPTEVAVVGAIVAGGITAYGVYSRNANVPPDSKSSSGAKASGKKGKGKKKAESKADADFEKIIAAANKENAAAAANTRVVRAPDVVPGTFDFNPTSNSESDTKEKKTRKKKGKKGAAGAGNSGESQMATSSSVVASKEETPVRPEQVVVPQAVQANPPAQPSQSSKKNKKRKTKSGASASTSSDPLVASIDLSDAGDDASWTRVSTRKKNTASTSENPPSSIAGASSTDAELLTSDTNLTSGATDPDLTETEEEDAGIRKADTVTRKTFAERMLPRPRKTGVEDMEDEPLQPTLARVIAVRPAPGEKPAKGFSWGDYEEYAGADEGPASGADVSNDDAWEEVKSKKKPRATNPSTSMMSSTDSLSRSEQDAQMSKKKRQNAEKREAAKTEKELAERDRLEKLAAHKRELEKVRIAEQYASGGGKKAVSGGMQATVGEGGKLIWE